MTDMNYFAQLMEGDPTFSSVPNGSVVLVETSIDVVKHIAPILISKFGISNSVVLLLTDKSFSSIARDYKVNHIAKDRLAVVDCVAKQEGHPFLDDIHRVNLKGLSDLESMFASVFHELDSFSGRKFLCIDSLNQLINVNGKVNVAKLLHIVLTQLRAQRVGCLMISVQDSLVEVVRAEIVQLFDKVVHF